MSSDSSSDIRFMRSVVADELSSPMVSFVCRRDGGSTLSSSVVKDSGLSVFVMIDMGGFRGDDGLSSSGGGGGGDVCGCWRRARVEA